MHTDYWELLITNWIRFALPRCRATSVAVNPLLTWHKLCLKTEQECSKMFLQIMTPVCLMNTAGSDTVFIPGGRSLMYIVTPQIMTNQS
jgi:hypothetical protein